MLARLTTNKKDDLKTINRRLIRNVEVKNQKLLKEIYDHKMTETLGKREQ